MRMYYLIMKKRNGGALNEEEIHFLIQEKTILELLSLGILHLKL